MKMIMAMMYLLPKKMRDQMKAPMMQKGRYASGKNHASIPMNLTNLLVCAQHCGTCPSYSGVRGEALFCASGPSSLDIAQNGCNCVTCPVFEKCGSQSSGYFCINGPCGHQENQTKATQLTDTTTKYLQRFMPQDNVETKMSDNGNNNIKNDKKKDLHTNIQDKEPNNEKKITMRIGNKQVTTNSNTTILKTSLDAGIPHTHICGGRARCSTCRVIITDGLENCRPRNDPEQKLAKLKGFPDQVRLACQTTAHSDIALRRLVLDDADISEAISQGRTNPSDSGREVEATILFSDIRSFTSFSEFALPYDVIHVLNRYFEQTGSIIDSLGGYIDKYMGDGIMVIFGLDQQQTQNHAILAAQAAIGMKKALSQFNTYLAAHFDHEFNIGIGLHSGTVIVGNLGFSKKREFTAIGDTVNTASRIESLNKKTNTTILASHSTYQLSNQVFSWGKTYKTKVKGKTESIIVHELLDTNA